MAAQWQQSGEVAPFRICITFFMQSVALQRHIFYTGGMLRANFTWDSHNFCYGEKKSHQETCWLWRLSFRCWARYSWPFHGGTKWGSRNLVKYPKLTEPNQNIYLQETSIIWCWKDIPHVREDWETEMWEEKMNQTGALTVPQREFCDCSIHWDSCRKRFSIQHSD